MYINKKCKVCGHSIETKVIAGRNSHFAQTVRDKGKSEIMSKVIGITGGIATGKSTVSELLTAYGFKIVDADIASREAVKKALRVLNKLKRFLGKKQLTKMVR